MLYLALALVITVADQLFKYWITANIPLGGHMDLIPGVIGLTYVQNTGAAFSLFSGMRWLLLVVTAAASVLIIVLLFQRRFATFGLVSLAMILGGALGNLIDRLFLGYVVDMFEVQFTNYAIFNIADCFVVVGGILFCIYYLFLHDKYKKRLTQISETAADGADAAPADTPEPETDGDPADVAAEPELADVPDDTPEPDAAPEAPAEAADPSQPEDGHGQ